MIHTSAYTVAERFVGMSEIPGSKSNPQILAMLKLDMEWPEDDAVPWCSGFVNYVCWLLRMPRSKSLRARSWLLVGRAIQLENADAGADVVILKRGGGDQPGPEVIEAPGHVGFYSGHDDTYVYLLGGNQGNAVSVARYHRERILGIRRL